MTAQFEGGNESKIINKSQIINYMIEIWKDVIGYEGLYEVSNLGRVRSWIDTHGNKRVEPLIIGGYEVRGGYLQVAFCKDRKYKRLLIHRVVVEAFILGRKMKKGEFCDHINTIRSDNRVENLRVCSHKENCNNPLTLAKYRCLTNANKQLDLLEVEYPHRELTFRSSSEASKFFNYKLERQIGTYISQARKKGSNIINIKGRDYYYAQEKKGVANV